MMGAFRYIMIGLFSVAATQMFLFQIIYVYHAFSDLFFTINKMLESVSLGTLLFHY